VLLNTTGTMPYIACCMAAEATDPKAKALLLFMAGAWNNLADHANRNRMTSREIEDAPGR
jgi:hypothetical protein